MIPAWSYARDSSQMQAEKGLSIPAQLKENQKYAKANGYEIIEEFIDDAFTGTNMDRPAFQNMLAAIKTRRTPAKAIICWKSDRFARSVEQASAFRGLLRRHGIDLITVAEPNVEGPVGAIVNAILDSVNEFYSLRLAEDTLRGGKEAASRGYAQGGTPPFGMKKVPIQNGKGQIHMKYAPDPETAPIVLKIYHLYAEGRSLMSIAKTLEDQGIPTQRGGTWNSTQVWNTLFKHQPTYLGHLVYNKTRVPKRGGTHLKKSKEEWVICHNAHEAIIPQDLANTVNRLRQDRPDYMNVNRNTIKSSEDAILRGKIFCGICGSPYSSSWGGKCSTGRRRYYSCGGKRIARLKGKSVPKCSNAWIRMEQMHEIVMGTVQERVLAPGFGNRLADELNKENETVKDTANGQKEAIKRALEDLKKKRSRIIDAIADGIIQAHDAKDKMNALNKSIQSNEHELIEAEATVAVPHHTEMIAALEKLDNILQDPDALSAFALAMIRSVIVYPDKLEIHYKLLFDPDTLPRPKTRAKVCQTP